MASSRSLPPGSKGCRNLRKCVRDGESVLVGTLYRSVPDNVIGTHVAAQQWIGIYDAVENAIRYNGELYSLNDFANSWCLKRYYRWNPETTHLGYRVNGWSFCKVRDVDGRWIVMSRLKPLSEVNFSNPTVYERDVTAATDEAEADEREEERERKGAASEAEYQAACDKHEPGRRIRNCRTNVNELVNAELYAKVSVVTGKSIAYLKRNYTPQEMRAALLLRYKEYYEGPLVTRGNTAPHEENRGIAK